jgi:hypothetical protein
MCGGTSSERTATGRAVVGFGFRRNERNGQLSGPARLHCAIPAGARRETQRKMTCQGGKGVRGSVGTGPASRRRSKTSFATVGLPPPTIRVRTPHCGRPRKRFALRFGCDVSDGPAIAFPAWCTLSLPGSPPHAGHRILTVGHSHAPHAVISRPDFKLTCTWRGSART